MSIQKIDEKFQYSNFYHGATGATMLYTGTSFLHSIVIAQGTNTALINIYDTPTSAAWVGGTMSNQIMASLDGSSIYENIFDCKINNGLFIDPTTTASVSFAVIWRKLS